MATPGYDAAGELSSVAYGNGTTLSQLQRDDQGRVTKIGWSNSGGLIASDGTAVYSPSSRLMSSTITPGAAIGGGSPIASNYGYDGAGRLINATVGTNVYTYDFGASTCGNTVTGKNSNRTSVTTNGSTVNYCYDAADRITSGGTIGTPIYDTHGNTTSIGGRTLRYDQTDRSIGLVSGATDTTYVRDATDRIIRRSVAGLEDYYFDYEGPGDNPDFQRSAASPSVIAERTWSLPGGVTLQKHASGGDTWAHPNLHGDVLTTTDSAGAVITANASPGTGPLEQAACNQSVKSSARVKTTPAFTPPAAVLLVALISSDSPTGASNDHTVTSGGGLTWTRAGRVGSGAGGGTTGQVEVWSAYATTSPGSITVTGTATTASSNGMLVVRCYANADPATPPVVGGTALSAASISALLTTSRQNSLVLAVASDTGNVDSPDEHVVGAGQTLIDSSLTTGSGAATTTTTAPGVTTTTTTTTMPPPGGVDQAYAPSAAPTSEIALGSQYAVETGHRVTLNCAGTVPGVWWWRSAQDTGTITVHAWRNGAVVGTGSGNPAAGPGWRYVAFTAPVAVTVGDHLVVGVHHPNGAYGYSNNGFTGRAVTSASGCITLDASTAAAKNGLYDYSATPVLPTLSYLDSEYWLSPAVRPGRRSHHDHHDHNGNYDDDRHDDDHDDDDDVAAGWVG